MEATKKCSLEISNTNHVCLPPPYLNTIKGEWTIRFPGIFLLYVLCLPMSIYVALKFLQKSIFSFAVRYIMVIVRKLFVFIPIHKKQFFSFVSIAGTVAVQDN